MKHIENISPLTLFWNNSCVDLHDLDNDKKLCRFERSDPSNDWADFHLLEIIEFSITEYINYDLNGNGRRGTTGDKMFEDYLATK